MAEPGPGAVCDSCFMECHASLVGGRWRYPCDDDARTLADRARALERYGEDDGATAWAQNVDKLQNMNID